MRADRVIDRLYSGEVGREGLQADPHLDRREAEIQLAARPARSLLGRAERNRAVNLDAVAMPA
jgi:hypothetical protein